MATAENVGLPLGEAGDDFWTICGGDTAQRFQTLELTFAEQVELEALLQHIVGLAKSRDGDRAAAGAGSRTVTEQEVIDAYHRHGRYLTSHLLRHLA